MCVCAQSVKFMMRFSSFFPPPTKSATCAIMMLDCLSFIVGTMENMYAQSNVELSFNGKPSSIHFFLLPSSLFVLRNLLWMETVHSFMKMTKYYMRTMTSWRVNPNFTRHYYSASDMNVSLFADFYEVIFFWWYEIKHFTCALMRNQTEGLPRMDVNEIFFVA